MSTRYPFVWVGPLTYNTHEPSPKRVDRHARVVCLRDNSSNCGKRTRFSIPVSLCLLVLVKNLRQINLQLGHVSISDLEITVVLGPLLANVGPFSFIAVVAVAPIHGAPFMLFLDIHGKFPSQMLALY